MYQYIPLTDEGGLGITPGHAAQAPIINPINGKIVMATTGASSLATEGEVLAQIIAQGKALGEVNPIITFINLAIAARDINDWLDTSDTLKSCWNKTTEALNVAGLNYSDIQIIWLKEDDLKDQSADDGRIVRLFWKFVDLIHLLKEKFPNLKRIYVSGRSCTLPQADVKHAEPRPFFTGLVAKMLVQEQIAGNPELDLSVCPWISDILYLWTNEDMPRESDGYGRSMDSWKNDGIHPNEIGDDQVATYVYNTLLDYTDFFPAGGSVERNAPWFDDTPYEPIPVDEYYDPGTYNNGNPVQQSGSNAGAVLIGLGVLYGLSKLFKKRT